MNNNSTALAEKVKGLDAKKIGNRPSWPPAPW